MGANTKRYTNMLQSLLSVTLQHFLSCSHRGKHHAASFQCGHKEMGKLCCGMNAKSPGVTCCPTNGWNGSLHGVTPRHCLCEQGVTRRVCCSLQDSYVVTYQAGSDGTVEPGCSALSPATSCTITVADSYDAGTAFTVAAFAVSKGAASAETAAVLPVYTSKLTGLHLCQAKQTHKTFRVAVESESGRDTAERIVLGRKKSRRQIPAHSGVK